MPVFAETAPGDVVQLVTHITEGVAAAILTVAAAWHVIRTQRQDDRKKRIEVDQDEYNAQRKREDDERRTRGEERDHTIEELRGLIEEAKTEAREAKRDLRRSQETTAKRMAEIQAAHHECERQFAAATERMTIQGEQLLELRGTLQTLMNQRALDERRINELESRGENGASAPEGHRD